ncbi:bifunctional (p)ppGpp synthetase/guanosine-3',5'-bis(diphosphate) 3'-pyrophosphohydrolase [bacterium]|nr:bifunctional (p)ppGpp synthetase/guanosine-3',5'-bis(diphosphate) 3'-pyrophosphohydrolase [bacterium]
MKFKLPQNPNIADLMLKVSKRGFSIEDKEKINKAFLKAEKFHKNQLRKTGEPYLIHPLATAYYLVELGMDTATIVAGLLHDTVEDTEYKIEELRGDFGDEVSELVEGVTRLGGVKYFGKKGKAEDLRKLLLIMAKDLRVIVVKLADRLHNMQTIYALPSIKRRKIAKETIEIYAPLASRLGMGEMKGLLEDLSFKYYLPHEYKKTLELLGKDQESRDIYINKVVKFINEKLGKEKIKAHVDGRAKHLYSLYKKLSKHSNDISKIYDLEAIRIVVGSISDCYKVLGLVHKEWKPLLKRIKDYIAIPKPNGYRSLHTTVFALDGKIIEIQIKTQEMHEEAEWGIAAHWHYKEIRKSKEVPEKLRWINRLLSWQKELGASEFMEGFKSDVFRDRIFVFTPKGEAIDLQEGATPIDFAYAIHTQIGNSCVGAKVNGKIVPLSYELRNGSLIEIITSKKQLGPSRDWIRFAKTPTALHEIRKWLRSQDKDKNLEIGRDLLNEELKKIGKTVDKISKNDIASYKAKNTYSDLDSILIAIGEGFLKPKKVLSDLYFPDKDLKPKKGIFSNILPIFNKHQKREPKIIVEGEGNMLLSVASCCNPKPYSAIKGYITRGKGISVHKADCPNIINKKDNRVLNASWDGSDVYGVTLFVEAHNNSDILKKLTDIFSKMFIEAKNMSLKKNSTSKVTLDIEFSKPEQLREIIEKISDIEEVILVKKLR